LVFANRRYIGSAPFIAPGKADPKYLPQTIRTFVRHKSVVHPFGQRSKRERFTVARLEREKHLPHPENPEARNYDPQGSATEADVASTRERRRKQSKIFAFGGGKGGVGKTILTAGFGLALARSGKRVILVDADLGGSNLHLAMGVEIPAKTLHDFMRRRVRSLGELLCETPIPSLQFVSGAPGIAGMADRKSWEKQKLIRHIRKLDADFVLVDIGAGMSFNEIDLFLAADTGIVVANPEPPSIQEAYNFVKVCLFRKLIRLFRKEPEVVAVLKCRLDPSHQRDTRLVADILEEIRTIDSEAATRMEEEIVGFRPKLILNLVYDPQEVIEGMALQVAVDDLLGLKVDNWGHIVHDPAVAEAVRSMRPELLLPPGSPATECVEGIVRRHFSAAEWEVRGNPRYWTPLEREAMFAKGEDMNEVICSCNCELWGNCSVQHGGFPCRIKYVAFARQNNGYARSRAMVAA
jgi:flagellar biosynthesis protein FlhG